MLRFFIRRVALTVPTFIALMFVTFVAVRMVPGDPIEVRTGERGISPERLAQFRHELGLDQPVWQQFLHYANGLIHGDFGLSIVTKTPVLQEFLTLFPATLELSICALIFAIVLGVPAGVLAAVKRGSVLDHAVMSVALAGYSMPIFWWGLLLIMFMSEYLGLTPVSGRMDLINYYFEPVTGFMLIDSLLSEQEGAFSAAVSASHLAVHRARHHPARRDRADDALLHAGSAGRGLCAHRPRQGAARRCAWWACTRCATR